VQGKEAEGTLLTISRATTISEEGNMSSILTHRTFGLESLTVDIHRLTAQTAAPGCTLEQVKEVLQRFGYQRYTRAEVGLCLYWQLAACHENEWPCQTFLEQVKGRMLQNEGENAHVPHSFAAQGSDHSRQEDR